MKYTKTIRASKKSSAPRSVKASSRFARKAVKAEDEINEEIPAPEVDAPVEDAPVADGEPEVTVEAEASTLLFEAEEVGELLAEATGKDVIVEVDDEGEGSVTFTVGEEDEFVVTPSGDEEILEASRTRGARRVSASKRAMASRRAMAARRARAARRVSASGRSAAPRRVSASRRTSAARRASRK